MKRNDLVARSLTLGLAVATAAASMSTPGGLMAPVTVQAEGTQTAATEAPAVSFSDSKKPAVGDTLAVTLKTANEGAAYTWYAVDENTETAENAENSVEPITGQTDASLTITKYYVGKKILVVVKENSGESETEIGRALSDVITYAALPADAVVKFGDAKMSECTTKLYKDAVSVTAQTAETSGKDYYIADTVEGLASATTYSFAKGDNEDGAVTKTLYFKTADGTDIYQQEITVNFDTTKPAISAATVSDVTKNSAKVTVTATDASTESGRKLTFKLQNKAEAGTSPSDNDTGEFDLSVLDPNTTYNYTLTVTDEAGNEATYESDVTFKTLKTEYSGTQPAVGTFTKEGRTLTFTFAATSKEAKDFDYTLDAGQSWTNGDAATTILSVAPTQGNEGSTTITLTLPTDAYAEDTIKVRVAETDDHLAGDWVAYGQAVPEGVAPVLSAIQASDVTAADTSVKVNVTSNEIGKVYALAKKKGEPAPDAAAVKAGNKFTEIQSAGAATEVTVNELTANTEYVIYFVAEDAAENLSEVQSVEVTTLQTALTGTAKLDGTTTVRETLTASVEGGNGSTFTYAWYRIPVVDATEQTPVQITGANESTYTLVADDAGCKIKVVITAEGFSGSKEKTTEAAVEKKTCSIELGDASSLFASGVTGDAGSKVLNVTVPEKAQSSALEYSFDGTTWADLSGATIPLANKSYDAGTIKVRVKETEDTKAGDVVAYDKAIKSTLNATVEITGTLKYNETLTAKATIKDDAQSGATLKYQFFSVDGKNATSLGEASATATYKLTASEIGKQIKVVVTADGYDGSAEYVTTATVDQADGRTITINDVISAIVKPSVGTETYTYTMKTVNGAKYQMTAGANTSASETWGETYEFSGLTPGQSYTFHAIMPETTEYKAGTPISFTIDFPKLTHTPLLLDYNVAGQTVTISQPDQERANIEYTFDGGTTWGTAYEHEYEQGVKEVTIGIRYKDSDIYNEVTPITESLDLSKETQTTPNSASIAVKTNPAKTKYQITITEPDNLQEGETMEYSLDGVNYTTESDIESREFGANTTVTLYYRKKATATANASKTQFVGQELYGASATPVITGAEGATTFKDSLVVTLKASGTIYYTTDGSAPTVDSTVYSEPITINATKTIKAIAVEEGRIISEVASETFTKE